MITAKGSNKETNQENKLGWLDLILRRLTNDINQAFSRLRPIAEIDSVVITKDGKLVESDCLSSTYYI